jgi:hypothetical protein
MKKDLTVLHVADLGAEETLETVENMQQGEIIEANLGGYQYLN